VDPASVISLIAVAVVAIFSSVTAPIILSHRTERMHREDQLEQYRREDEVAREAKITAQALAGQQDTIIRQQKETSRDARETAQKTDGKLDVIHGLVNSTLSAAMTSEMDALVTSAAMMREVMDLKKSMGREPSREAVIALQSTEAKIAELRTALADRTKQAEALASHALAAASDRQAATREAEAQAKPL
jgi:hypothetical protein